MGEPKNWGATDRRHWDLQNLRWYITWSFEIHLLTLTLLPCQYKYGSPCKGEETCRTHVGTSRALLIKPLNSQESFEGRHWRNIWMRKFMEQENMLPNSLSHLQKFRWITFTSLLLSIEIYQWWFCRLITNRGWIIKVFDLVLSDNCGQWNIDIVCLSFLQFKRCILMYVCSGYRLSFVAASGTHGNSLPWPPRWGGGRTCQMGWAKTKTKVFFRSYIIATSNWLVEQLSSYKISRIIQHTKM